MDEVVKRWMPCELLSGLQCSGVANIECIHA